MIEEAFSQKAKELGFEVVAIASRMAMLKICGWTTVVRISDHEIQNFKTLVVTRGRVRERVVSSSRKFSRE